jgi:hypothetical protein
VRSQYAISANLYCNPSFSVLWYHTSPPDALEPNTTHSLGGMGLSPWGTHPMLGTCLEAQCEPNPDCQDAAFARRAHKLPTAPQGTGFMFGYPHPVWGDGQPFPALPSLTLNLLPQPFPSLSLGHLTPRSLILPCG